MEEYRDADDQFQRTNLIAHELEALRSWLTGYDIASRGKKKLNRDFSDGVLLAEILKLEFPTLVEIHNYTRCSSVQSKIDNWKMLNKRVLRKLQIHLKCDEMEKLAKADTFFIEVVLFRIMNQIQDFKSDNCDKELRLISSAHSSISTSTVVRRNLDQGSGDQEQPHESNASDFYVAEEIQRRDAEIEKLRSVVRELQDENSMKCRQIEELEIRLKEKSQKSMFSLGSIRNSLNNLF